MHHLAKTSSTDVTLANGKKNPFIKIPTKLCSQRATNYTTIYPTFSSPGTRSRWIVNCNSTQSMVTLVTLHCLTWCESARQFLFASTAPAVPRLTTVHLNIYVLWRLLNFAQLIIIFEVTVEYLRFAREGSAKEMRRMINDAVQIKCFTQNKKFVLLLWQQNNTIGRVFKTWVC